MQDNNKSVDKEESKDILKEKSEEEGEIDLLKSEEALSEKVDDFEDVKIGDKKKISVLMKSQGFQKLGSFVDDKKNQLRFDDSRVEEEVIYDETTKDAFYKENKRKIKISIPKKVYGNNSIVYRKYTNWSFIIINLFEQFSRPVNIYFLFLSILQLIPQISISNDNPTILIPLFFIIILQMLRDLSADIKIHKLDQRDNLKQIEIIRNKIEKINTEDLYPGEVIVVKENEQVPADCILLYSSNLSDDCCYVDVASLTGHTTL
jgi:magnesium-transporting ATPase (P-type)